MEEDEKPTICERIPQRYVVTGLICLVLCYNVSARGIMKTQMYFISAANYNKSHHDSIVCKNFTYTTDLTDYRGEIFHWSKKDLHLFYHFYAALYIFPRPAIGYLCDRYIKLPRVFILITLLASNIYSLLSPTIMAVSADKLWYFKVIRGFFGLCHSPQMPAAFTILSHWVPPRQRASLCCIAFAGVFLGIVIKRSFTFRIIVSTGSWRLPSYLIGGLGIPLTYIWYKYGFSDPTLSPEITQKELSYLDKQMKSYMIRENKPVPVFKILSRIEMWIMIMGNIGPDYFRDFVRSTLNDFNRRAYFLTHRESVQWVTLPYGMCIATIVILGFLSDYIVQREYMDTITLRKFFTNFGVMGPPIYALAATYAGCHKQLAQVLEVISMFFEGCVYVGIRLLLFDLAPNYVGLMFGLIGWNDFVGLLIGSLEDLISTKTDLQQFRKLFVLCLLLAVFSNLWVIMLGHVKTPARRRSKERNDKNI